MDNSGVSCLCLTYGRPHLLEEAVESFLRQKWDGPKELIIVNDHPQQTIIYNHSEVTVINIPRRLHSLGEKRNLSVALAKYDNLLIWDDDDIYLPNRIIETMKTLPSKQFFKCPNAWIMDDGVIGEKPGFNLFHGGSAYTRWLFEKAGGYKPLNGGEDADIEGRFQLVTENKGEFWPHTTLSDEHLYYIYRWTHGSYHTTGQSKLTDINPDITPGDYKLNPHWNADYVSLAKDAAKRLEIQVAPVVKSVKKIDFPIDFICFSRNRPLQLEGYLRSIATAFLKEVPISVLYTCDPKFEKAYADVIAAYPSTIFLKETKFSENLMSLISDKPYTCFGCDDVVFGGNIEIHNILHRMENAQQFAFSLRLGQNISRSMFSGATKTPEWVNDGRTLTWDLHQSHSCGDFGYSWELDGTIYHTDLLRKVIEDVNPSSPNILEANGGGKWSSKTQRSLMSCFPSSKLLVPTVNVVQRNFSNPVIGTEMSVDFLLQAWQCGLRLDVKNYRVGLNDCIHVPDIHLTNRLT